MYLKGGKIMGSVYVSDVEKQYQDWMGYKEGANNWTIFSKVLDDCNYYQPQKKQNQPWCATTPNFMILQAALPYDRENTSKKYDAQYVQYQPDRYNYSCGAEEHAGYFKSAGAFFTDQTKAKAGDIVYFWRTVNGKKKIGHVGWLSANSGKVLTVYEGNAGDMLQTKWYDIGTSEIAGFGRPRYDGDVSPNSVKKEEKAEEPVKDTAPGTKSEVIRNNEKSEVKAENTLTDEHMHPHTTVVAATELVLREKANTTSNVLTKIPQGTVLRVSSFTGDYGYCSYGYYQGYVLMNLEAKA